MKEGGGEEGEREREGEGVTKGGGEEEERGHHSV